MDEISRNRAIDVTKAIGIILVVIGHIPGLYHPLWKAIYSFHMPLFFIMAGAVYTQREPLQVMARGAKTLLRPYFIVICISVLMAWLFGNIDQVRAYMQGLLFPDGNRGNYIVFANWPSVEAMWFFPAMFCCRLIYSCVKKYIKENALVVCAVIQLLCALIGRTLLNLPFGLLVGGSAVFFFSAGRMMVNIQGGGIRNKSIALVGFVNLWLLSIWKGSFSIMYFYYNIESYIVDAFVAIGATWLVYQLAKRLENSKILNIIGKETLLILCCHEIIRQLLGDLSFVGIRFGIYRGAVLLIVGTIVLSTVAIFCKHKFEILKQTK